MTTTIDRTASQPDRWRANVVQSRAWLDALPRVAVDPATQECWQCAGDEVVPHEACDGDGCDNCDDTGDWPCDCKGK